MSALPRLQNDFFSYLQTGNMQIADAIMSSDGIATKDRLFIYYNAYRLRFLECLQNDFPQLHGYMGDDKFESLGREYIDANPSSFTSLRYFGDALPMFLATTQPYAAIPILAELATFERTLGFSFDAADATPVTVDDMAAIAPDLWPTMMFTLVPSAKMVALYWNTVSIWKAMEQGIVPDAPKRSEDPIQWMLWRRSDQVSRYRSLAADEVIALQCLQNSENFAAICTRLSDYHDDDAVTLRVAQLLRGWIEEELVAMVELPSAA